MQTHLKISAIAIRLSLALGLGLLTGSALANDWLRVLSHPQASGEVGQTNVTPARDGGLLMAACISASAGSPCLNGPSGDSNIAVMKTDRFGVGQGTWIYGGTGNDRSYQIIETQDRDQVVIARTQSFGPVAQTLIMKLASRDGRPLWRKRTVDGRIFSAIAETRDGSLLLLGSPGILKLDRNGNFQSLKIPDRAALTSIRQTRDGGFILTGAIGSAPNRDVLVVRLRADGEISWQKTFGSSNDDTAADIAETRDGDFVLAGAILLTPAPTAVVLRLSPNGNPRWSRSYGAPQDAYSAQGASIQETEEGDVLVAGQVAERNIHGARLLLLRLDRNGNFRSRQTVVGAVPLTAGDRIVSPFRLERAVAGGFTLGGYTNTFTGPNAGLFLTLDKDGGLGDCSGFTTEGSRWTPGNPNFSQICPGNCAALIPSQQMLIAASQEEFPFLGTGTVINTLKCGHAKVTDTTTRTGASAHFSSRTACDDVAVDIEVAIQKETIVPGPPPPISPSIASVVIRSTPISTALGCSGIAIDAHGAIYMANGNFVIDPGLNLARLAGSANMSDSAAGGASLPITVDIAWRATGPPIPASSRERQDLGDFIEESFFAGVQRQAEASGRVVNGARNFSPVSAAGTDARMFRDLNITVTTLNK